MTRGGSGGSPFFPIGLSPTTLTPVSLALFTHVAARMVAKPPLAARYIGVLQTMLLPPSSAPTTTGWSDSCRAGFAPAREWRLARRTQKIVLSLAELPPSRPWDRIPKPFYMLACVDDEHYRRGILTQLNRGESRHNVTRAVSWPAWRTPAALPRGPRGPTRGIGAGRQCHRVVEYHYMAAALKELSRAGCAVCPEDVTRLSPLIHRHLNFQGRRAFVLPEAVAQGQLRPLHDPRQEL